ncbi:hypothetical protein JCM33374_g1426 [Metschnikowia sp. JCM 33374]|nr:hypothetical protein JCM33374_g1426 [Metschnikowia sp. JCM 33374]
MARASSEPYQEMPEFYDHPDVPQLISHIRLHLNERLSPYDVISTRNDYVRAAQTFPDIAMEYFCILAKTGLAGHSWLWLSVLTRLAHICTKLAQQRKLHSAASDVHVASAAALYLPVFHQVARNCEIFFDSADLRVFFNNTECGGLSRFLKCVNASLGLCVPDKTHLKHGSIVPSVVSALTRGFSLMCAHESTRVSSEHEFKVTVFPTLVETAKTAFHTGSPQAILPLLFPNDPGSTVPLPDSFLSSIVPDPRITLPLITDYYRYFAFCLVTCVTEGSVIDEGTTNKADIFLKVLINLPHLHLSNYMAEALASGEMGLSTPPRLVPGVEREEMSFFYLLNCLLRIRSLSDYVDPGYLFKRERRFFITSFNKRCGAELDFSASASSSRAGSVASVTRGGDSMNRSYGTTSAHVTLSSILSEGSYKEKVRLVAEFFNLAGESAGAGSIKRLVETFDISSLHHRTNHFRSSSHDVSQIFNRIDPQQYPGKIAYVKALDMVVRLLQLVSLKCLNPSFGKSVHPADLLAKLFKTNYSVRDIISVKDLLDIDVNDQLHIRYRSSASEADLLAKQFHLLETTRSLRNDVQKLI